MKNLFYKEMKLSMHPVIWVFIFVFPLLALIPNYPLFISFIYIASCYPILFLGANKGQQSNDILYSCLLPIRKRDVIRGRMMTLAFIRIIPIILTSVIAVIANIYKVEIGKAIGGNQPTVSIGFNSDGIVSLIAFAFIAFAIYDFIYCCLFYKNGRSVVLPTILGMLFLVTFLTIFTLVLPMVLPGYMWFFCYAGLGYQFIYLAVAIGISIAIHILTLNLSTELLNKVDL